MLMTYICNYYNKFEYVINTTLRNLMFYNGLFRYFFVITLLLELWSSRILS